MRTSLKICADAKRRNGCFFMKKMIILAAAVIAVAMLVACTRKEEGSSVAQEISELPGSSEAVPIPSEPSAPPDVMEKIVVADAAMYRGTLLSKTENESGFLLTLSQAKGTNFGAAEKMFLWNDDTRASFPLEGLTEGAYLEVYYGAALGAPPSEAPQTIIGANRYDSAEMVNFNGKLLEKLLAEDGSIRSLRMQSLENDEEVIYHIGKETKVYLNWEKVAVGDALNIFTNGIRTMSLPPQAPALEIRKMA